MGVPLVSPVGAQQSNTTTFEYDELGRLEKTTYEGGETDTQAYDATGNRTTETIAGAAGGGGGSSEKTIFLTSGATWSVPSDWNDANNKIHLIGGGGGAGDRRRGGGGGGAYAQLTNFDLTPSATVYINVGSGGAGSSGNGGAGGDTWLNKTANAAPSSTADGGLADGGRGASWNAGGAGGSAASSVGDETSSGGSGGGYSAIAGGAGGGGAAGDFGAGGSGAAAGAANGGSGGGGSGGGGSGTAGSDGSGGSSNYGGAGGNNAAGAGGGAQSPWNGPANDGASGGGASGGGGNGNSGGAGGEGDEYTQTSDSATAGPGGGGGGAGDAHGNPREAGGHGGLYGGGGGGAGDGASGTPAGGNGAQGIIIIQYTPAGGGGNQPPTALDDTNVTVTEDASVTFNPRSNDSDPDGDGLQITTVSVPSNGSAAINGGVTVTYTPDGGFFGPDSFTYTISDGNGGTDTATVSVDVTASSGSVVVGTATVVDTTGQSSPFSTAYTPITDADVVVAIFAEESGGTAGISGTPTFAGQNMTKAIDRVTSSGFKNYCSIWYLDNPPTGSNNLQFSSTDTGPAPWVYAITSVKGVSTGGPHLTKEDGTTATVNAFSTSGVVNEANDFVLTGLASGEAVTSTPDSGTELFDQIEATSMGTGHYETVSQAGTNSYGYTFAGGNNNGDTFRPTMCLAVWRASTP